MFKDGKKGDLAQPDYSGEETEPWRRLTGTFVFSRTGAVVYHSRQKTPSDSPNIQELMNACRLAAGTCVVCCAGIHQTAAAPTQSHHHAC